MHLLFLDRQRFRLCLELEDRVLELLPLGGILGSILQGSYCLI